MLRLACVVVIVVGALALAAPRGKVVRVERNRGMKVIPKLCEVQPSSGTGQCIGQPRAGERIALLDQERSSVIGEFRIDSTSATDAFICVGSQPIVFSVTGAVSKGDPDAIADANHIIGLRNLSLDQKIARVVENQSVPGTRERAELAIDVDGNGSVDYMLVRYNCDENGNPSATHARGSCFDTYVERGGLLVKAHTDNIHVCN